MQVLDPAAGLADANQRALMREIARLRTLLDDGPAAPADSETPPALDRVCRTFELSAFERAILVMCAAMELDGSFRDLCAAANGDPARPYPTFGLALAALPDAHWSAVTPQAPLRRWSLIAVGAEPSLICAPLRIDESILHELAGAGAVDARLRPLLASAGARPDLSGEQLAAAKCVAALLERVRNEPPLVQIVGSDAAANAAIAAAACALREQRCVALDARTLPRDPGDLERISVACARESRLHDAVLYLDVSGIDEGPDLQLAIVFGERTETPVIVGARDTVIFPRRGANAVPAGNASPGDADHPSAVVTAARARLDALAQRLPRDAARALVLPAAQRMLLADIVSHARNRTRVYDEWGMGGAGASGLSLSALFHGPSGTGKTLAAQAVGYALGLDVYRVDLSRLVSKYIGETEKNLRRVFDAAEDARVVLLFDECDAVFGRRGEVQHGQDRYANLEVSYLLQRIEAYDGVAILTTNMRNALDPAFLRRIRFVIAFPFPDFEQRLAIWERSFPDAVPTEGLDFRKTARLNVAGGNIRNIALNAAFRAADARRPVRMEDVLHAAVAECLKIERKPSDLEIGGWL